MLRRNPGALFVHGARRNHVGGGAHDFVLQLTDVPAMVLAQLCQLVFKPAGGGDELVSVAKGNGLPPAVSRNPVSLSCLSTFCGECME